MNAARVLVVDDNPANLKLASRVLECDGYIVDQAATAEDALELIRQQAPDLILMDIELPGMDGLTLTRALKADPATRTIPVVALTAYAMTGDEQRALDSGCDGYLTKPLSTRTLAAKVAEYIRGRWPRTAARILVVEDVPLELKLARVVLTTAGYEVVEAETGERALVVMQENPPDLVLLDVRLPGIHGAALIQQIRQDPATSKIPIIVLTSYPEDWTPLQASAAGCTAYYSKPIDADRLLAHIETIVGPGRPPERHEEKTPR